MSARRALSVLLIDVLLVAGLIGPSGASAATTAPTQPTAKTAARSVDRLTAATTGGAWAAAPTTVGATVFDSLSGRSVTLHGSLIAYTASTVKVPILFAALAASRNGNTAARAALSAHAAAMIKHSDNSATTAIWRSIGGTRPVLALTGRLGLASTTSAPQLYLPWDGVRTTSKDLAQLMVAMMHAKSPLTAADARYAVSLMGAVQKDQAWGVSAGVPAGDRVVLKNGWVPVPGRGWTVNSMGVISHGGHYYCVAITATRQASMAAGIRAVERIARQLAAHLG
jgi:beta-lactamase class A